MKLKRLLSLAGVIALLLMVAGSRLNAANAIDVLDGAGHDELLICNRFL